MCAAVETAERFSYYGINSNLITYLTGPLGQSTATAAENVNAWAGAAWVLPLLGLALLTLATVLTTLTTLNCQNTHNLASCSPPQLLVILFISSLYVVAIAQGGHRPNLQAFGADQFDGQDPKESIDKSSFFNWWNFCLSLGVLLSIIIIVYIQDNIGWALGYGILCVLMLVALTVFLLGKRTYRYGVKGSETNPFARIGRVFVAAVRHRHMTPSALTGTEEQVHQGLAQQSSEQFRCSFEDVEEAKRLLRLIPIWTTCLVYSIVYAQTSTFFTKQGATLNRTIADGLTIPAASLQLFIGVSIIILIPIYDRAFVPIARTLTRKPSGITSLQRIGTGIFFCAICMVVAALVETKRLKTAQEYGLVDTPDVTIPMSVWWLVPQYLLFGISDMFTSVGLQEFFYDEVPNELRSMGVSFYLSIIGTGSFLSSLIVSVIDKISSGEGESWFAINLNEAHLDYFYWLLAGLTAAGLVAFLFLARSFVYRTGCSN
ncbi:hypothetical protein PTKIN_Ptkin09bG0080000 [Pterospermum kingtungense]